MSFQAEKPNKKKITFFSIIWVLSICCLVGVLIYGFSQKMFDKPVTSNSQNSTTNKIGETASTKDYNNIFDESIKNDLIKMDQFTRYTSPDDFNADVFSDKELGI